jgi:predicted nuclease of predicted toxin-antitoxin system
VNKYFLDEMFSSVIAEIARRADVDVVSVHEERVKGATDSNVQLLATRAGRIVVTVNHKHFAPLVDSFYEQGLPHAGTLLVPGNVPTDVYAAIARAIIQFARDNPDGLQPYEIRWLHVDFT